jgi:predicted HicB family RNase H-like nuclease
MSIAIQPELHHAFKAAAAAQGQKMTKLIISFIEQYVRDHPVPEPKPRKAGRA